jgi:hypothetical protein
LYESERDIEDTDDIDIGFGVEYVYSSNIEIVEKDIEVNGLGVIYEYESYSDIEDKEDSTRDNGLYESTIDSIELTLIDIGLGVE